MSLNPITRNRKIGPVNERLSDMMVTILKSLEPLEDSDNCQANYFTDDHRKNMVSQLKLAEVALSDLRIRVRTFFIRINESFYKYESIKE